MAAVSWLQVGGSGSGEPDPGLTGGVQPLLSRVSRVHGAVTEQGPSLSPALSPTWHRGRAQPQEARKELGEGSQPRAPPPPGYPSLAQNSEIVPMSAEDCSFSPPSWQDWGFVTFGSFSCETLTQSDPPPRWLQSTRALHPPFCHQEHPFSLPTTHPPQEPMPQSRLLSSSPSSDGGCGAPTTWLGRAGSGHSPSRG